MKPVLFEIVSVGPNHAGVRVHNPPGKSHPGPWGFHPVSELAEHVEFLWWCVGRLNGDHGLRVIDGGRA